MLTIESRSFKEKLDQYRKQIRNQQIKSQWGYRRTQLINQQKIEQISLIFAKVKSLSQKKLLTRCWNIFLNPFPNEELQTTQVRQTIAIEWHVSFWQQYIDCLKKCPFQQSSSISELMLFLQEFKQINNWQMVQSFPAYADALSELIQLVLPEMNDSLRKDLAQWISDFKRIQLIVKLLSSIQQFAFPKTSNNIYSLVQKGLSSRQLQQQVQAANAIAQIIKYANSSEIYILYEIHPQLFQLTLDLLERHHKHDLAFYFWLAILYYLEIGRSLITQISRTGLINLCGKLIASGLEKNIFGGLSILTLFSCSQDPQVIDLLTIDEQLSDSKMWLKVCLQEKIYRHNNLDIRKLFFEIFRNVLLRWQQSHLNEVFLKMQFASVNLLDILNLNLKEEPQSYSLNFVCLQCLLGLMMRRKGMMVQIQSRGMIKLIQGFTALDSKDMKSRDICLTILQAWSSMKSPAMMISQ